MQTQSSALIKHDAGKAQQKREELSTKLILRLGELRESIFPANCNHPTHLFCRTIEQSTAWALDEPVSDLICVAIPFSDPDLAKIHVIQPLRTLGERVTDNFVNRLFGRHEAELDLAWRESSIALALEYPGKTPDIVRKKRETDVRKSIIEEISKPLWDKVESHVLTQRCWNDTSDLIPRSLYSYLRENLIGIPVLYALAAVAGAEQLFNRLEPVIENFGRFIPFVQCSTDTSDPAAKRFWLGLDLQA